MLCGSSTRGRRWSRASLLVPTLQREMGMRVPGRNMERNIAEFRGFWGAAAEKMDLEMSSWPPRYARCLEALAECNGWLCRIVEQAEAFGGLNSWSESRSRASWTSVQTGARGQPGKRGHIIKGTKQTWVHLLKIVIQKQWNLWSIKYLVDFMRARKGPLDSNTNWVFGRHRQIRLSSMFLQRVYWL